MEDSASETPTQEEPFDVPPEHIVLSSKGKGWHGFDAAEISHPLDDFALPALSRHILVVNLGRPQQVKEYLTERQGYLRQGSLAILPAGIPSQWHVQRQEEVRHLHLYLAPTLLSPIAEEAKIAPEKVELLDTLGDHDPQIEQFALLLLLELRSGGVGGRIYAESLANLLAVHLLRHHSSLSHHITPAPASLPRPALKRVTEYIEDHLSEDLSLNELAGVVNLSPYHFARLFKASTSLSPHQYVIKRRIERAKLLLATTTQPLLLIAHEVGFASESHLGTHFKRLTGLTPKHFRQDRQ